MKDAVTILRVKQLHPAFIKQITDFIDELETITGMVWRVVQGFRSFTEQANIYSQGRTAPGEIVTWSKAGQSYHCYGIAVDVAPFNADGKTLNWHFDYSTLKPHADSFGLTMGLFFPKPDSDHFENKFGHTWQDLLVKYNAKDFIPGTQFVNL